MKKIILATLLVSGFTLSAHANGLTGCAAKKADIEQQLAQAKNHNNAGQIKGLTKALAEVNANCTDASLMAERNAKITEKERKVAERQTELNQAQASGRADKIAKKQHKLAEAEQELKAAQGMLLK